MTLATHVVLPADRLDTLFDALRRRGYQLLGPTVRDAAIVYDEIEHAADLPAGYADTQEPGCYRVEKNGYQEFFGYTLAAQSWKRWLHPADVPVCAAARENGAFRILDQPNEAHGPYALVGVRACELAAIRRQDTVLRDGEYKDAHYERRRDGAFIVAVPCTHASATCFCASTGTGPQPGEGFDLSLTELNGGDGHRFVVRAATERGREVLAELDTERVLPGDLESAEKAVEQAAGAQQRRVNLSAAKAALEKSFDSPEWQKVAGRCLACGNCTQVCPTCFCTTYEDATDVPAENATRVRHWDSCFSLQFSYIHGGSVRSTVAARYRQWLMHKLAAWQEQFGESGCVGCGRCITWCPVGIDITAEVRAFEEAAHGNA